MQIGKGAFGVVRLVANKKNDEIFVSKEVQRTPENELFVLKEVETLRLLKGPHVIEFVEYFQSKRLMWIIFQH